MIHFIGPSLVSECSLAVKTTTVTPTSVLLHALCMHCLFDSTILSILPAVPTDLTGLREVAISFEVSRDMDRLLTLGYRSDCPRGAAHTPSSHCPQILVQIEPWCGSADTVLYVLNV